MLKLILDNTHIWYAKWETENTIIMSNHFEPLGTTVKVYTKTISAETEHIYIRDNILQFIPYGKTYTYEPNVAITNLCVYPKLNQYISEKELKQYSRIAEIGVRYGSSSKWILDNHNERLKYLDLYEYNKNCIDIFKNRLSNYSKYNIIQGNAEETLKENNHFYDLVFFDCSHIYEIDKKILEQLSSHINDSTTIIFDDYLIKDVQELVKFAQKEFNCKIIYKPMKKKVYK